MKVFQMLLLVSVMGCSSPLDKFSLTQEEITKVLQVQDPFNNRIALHDKTGKTQYLLLHECEVFRAITESGIVIGWTKIIDKPFYIIGSICVPERNNVNLKDSVVYVTLCVQGIGSSGGCAASEIYRTENAFDWEKLDELHNKWQVVVLPKQ